MTRPGTALLAGNALHKSFGQTRALDGAALAVSAGEVLAIMGASGSGKSTLLHCLAGIVRPDSGTIRYGGQDLVAMDDKGRSALRRTEFGFVFQFGQLVPELTCLENVALPLRLTGAKRGPAEAKAKEWLARLEVDNLAKRRPGDVSGGQAQRVAVARALVTGPKVVFADEPTGALDSLNGEKVMQMLTQAARETHAAVVLVTHEPRVAAYSDREIVVRDGRTVDRELVA
ncbi:MULTISPECIES: ABC transporter ATP-binding protein [Amycolatopsis]|uniref:ABC transporter ATP-binding protein n=1 Tax=Amycolatopsis dendrobii TaxID=2760662 RepID=A0A7W3VWT6_9PSEU|nr:MULTISPECIES: ABC transporter ATP-binding protein [Amycolatopsis]MBB1154673.1 ABC transporter ATP-binding protein [Amycolatopsis dendrobii]UKD56513.1 ABC transporter ATP-binding protein [Amycolatopsis sp. FU40]